MQVRWVGWVEFVINTYICTYEHNLSICYVRDTDLLIAIVAQVYQKSFLYNVVLLNCCPLYYLLLLRDLLSAPHCFSLSYLLFLKIGRAIEL